MVRPFAALVALWWAHAPTHGRPTVSVEQQLHFAGRGWVKIAGAVPELREPRIAAAIDAHYVASLREYANYSVGYLRTRHGLDAGADAHVAACGAVDYGLLARADGRSGATAFLERLACSARRENARGPGRVCEGRPRSRAFLGCDAPVTLPYFQGLNAHRRSGILYELATAPTLGAAAAALLLTPGVRLYQTATFDKSPGATEGTNTETSWHADLGATPLDVGGGGYVTFWCPVSRALARADGDSLLQFAAGSHRDASLHYWYDASAPRRFVNESMYSRSPRYAFDVASSLAVGDCTAHHGWVYHAAPAQSRRPRRAFGFSYVSADASVLRDLDAETLRWAGRRIDRGAFHLEDEVSYRDWLPAALARGSLDHPLLPLVYPAAPPPPPAEAPAGRRPFSAGAL